MRLNPIIFFVASLFLFLSCKKDHRVLGTEVQPADDLLNSSYSDTISVYAHTVAYDSIGTFNDRYKFLGSNQDPVFGRTDVGLYANVNIPNNVTNINFGNLAVLQSAEIKLTVASLDFVGDNNTPLTYSVFPITTALDKSKVYYTNQKSIYSGTNVLGSYTGTLVNEDSKLILKIKIDSAFGASILSNTTALQNNGEFLAFFKGIYVTSETSNLNPANLQGAIYKFDLDDDKSGFYLNYKDTAPQLKTYRFTFSGADASRLNTVKYQPKLSGNQILNKQITDKDSTFGKQNLFLKGLGGSRVKIHIPSIKNFMNDSTSLSINRAELEIKIDPTFTSSGVYVAPPKLALLPIEESGKETFAIDQLTGSDLLRYDGNYNETFGRYIFNIARHVQAIARGQRKNLGFYLVVADPSPIYTARRDNYATRVVLAGTDNASLKPKFRLTYVRLKHD